MVRSGEHIGWVEVQTNHHFINMSKGHSIFPSKGSCLKMEGPFLNGWDPINDFKWQPTNFGGSPVFYVQSSPNWKSEIFHAMLGSEPSKIPPPTVPTFSKKSCFFLVFSHIDSLKLRPDFVEWVAFFQYISYICSVLSCLRWMGISITKRIGLPRTAKASTQSPFNQPVKVENNEGVHSKCVACQSRGMGRIRKKLVGTVGGSSEIRGENHLGCTKPCKWWDKLVGELLINGCRISSINSSI